MRKKYNSHPTRPICVHCRNPYGQRDLETVDCVIPEKDEAPAIQSNKMLVRTRSWAYGTGLKRVTRELWDGQSWFGGYNPFCTLHCALDYARKAYRGERVALAPAVDTRDKMS